MVQSRFSLLAFPLLFGCGDSGALLDTGGTTGGESGSDAVTDGVTTPETNTETITETGNGSADGSTTNLVSTSDGSGATADSSTGTDATGGSTGEPGSDCTSDSDCGAQVCALYTDVEDDKDGTCVAVPAGGATRFTGTVFDLVTRASVASAQFQVSAALQVATNPTGATAIVAQDADAAGRFDVTSDGAVTAQIGVLGLASLGGYYLTATGLAAPDRAGAYPPTNVIHDQWIVAANDLSDWSDELSIDGAIDGSLLPLGDAGGTVGVVRNIETGAAIEGATVESTNNGSAAVVRYLLDDGSFGASATAASGIFVVLGPALAETFEARVEGAVVASGTAGSADGAVFTMVMDVP